MNVDWHSFMNYDELLWAWNLSLVHELQGRIQTKTNGGGGGDYRSTIR